ncbi:hypothetical protein IX332_001310 [Porphyromonas levii]|uniref:BACON domain-containing protein n=1 Tax=Porphyromonas levii TaxID=28114 RepID=UPI001B8C28BD|nr:BACON domain-containing protein [Porphyromonas levii]MBR8729981.1 hypothetical protein [Porphyromonas levii]
MKHFNYLTAFAVTLLLGLFASCTPKDTEVEEATLSLSATAVTIANAGGEAQAITVTTNQAKWNAISNVEWLKTKIAGNALTIVATPNQSGADRAAEVLVVAGATNEKISVVQSAADIVLEVSPENIVVTNAGETKLISVKSNSATWTLDIDEAASAWIKKTVFKDFIQLDIAPNDGAARETKIYAKSGKTQKEITVQQAGMGGNKFALPYLVADAKEYDLISYETKKGSFLLHFEPKSPGMPMFGVPPTGANYTFATSSEMFPSVYYLFDIDVDRVKIIEYLEIKENTKKLVDEGFVEFLKENGFEDAKYDDKSKRITGTHKDSRFTVSAKDDPKIKTAVVHFMAPKPEQDKEYATFNGFPYDNSSMIGKPEYTAKKVKEIEGKDNSKLTEEDEDKQVPGYIKTLTYEVDKSKRPLYIRLYFFDNKTKGADGKPQNNVSELLVIWDNVNLGAWEYNGGKYFLTKEFVSLLEKEGFQFHKEVDGLQFYYHATKKLMVVPRGAKFSDVLDGAPVFAINYFAFDGGSSAVTSQGWIEQIADRIIKQDRALGAK